MTPLLRWVAVGLLPVLAACGGDRVQTNKNLPTAVFKATPSGARPQVIKLDATLSSAPAGEIATYRWTFGDAEGAAPKNVTIPTEVHAYAAAGTFTITLVVVDDVGTESEPATQEVTVTSVNTDAPKAFISGPDTGTPGDTLYFDGSASTPQADIQSYAWDFNDPASGALNTSTSKTASHTWANPGSYRVQLTVTDSLGQSDTAEHLVAVGQVAPLAVCSFSPNPALQGVPVTFDGTASTAPDGATVKTYIWDFDDGSAPAAGATVMHTYNVQATFKPKLQIIDTQNRVAETTCPDVVVGAPPLCVGEYSISANPNMQQCSVFGTTTWAGVKMNIEQKADGTAVGSEMFNGDTIQFTGTWSGVDFTLNGSYSYDAGGDTVTTQATINGKFAGCGAWTGTWVEQQSSAFFGPLCTLTWNVSGSKL